jgi:hypothetical protein
LAFAQLHLPDRVASIPLGTVDVTFVVQHEGALGGVAVLLIKAVKNSFFPDAVGVMKPKDRSLPEQTVPQSSKGRRPIEVPISVEQESS